MKAFLTAFFLMLLALPAGAHDNQVDYPIHRGLPIATEWGKIADVAYAVQGEWGRMGATWTHEASANAFGYMDLKPAIGSPQENGWLQHTNDDSALPRNSILDVADMVVLQPPYKGGFGHFVLDIWKTHFPPNSWWPGGKTGLGIGERVWIPSFELGCTADKWVEAYEGDGSTVTYPLPDGINPSYPVRVCTTEGNGNKTNCFQNSMLSPSAYTLGANSITLDNPIPSGDWVFIKNGTTATPPNQGLPEHDHVPWHGTNPDPQSPLPAPFDLTCRYLEGRSGEDDNGVGRWETYYGFRSMYTTVVPDADINNDLAVGLSDWNHVAGQQGKLICQTAGCAVRPASIGGGFCTNGVNNRECGDVDWSGAVGVTDYNLVSSHMGWQYERLPLGDGSTVKVSKEGFFDWCSLPGTQNGIQDCDGDYLFNNSNNGLDIREFDLSFLWYSVTYRCNDNPAMDPEDGC